ncbi:hypothetical protein [Marinobacter salexigens]|uniref:Uncharacterized protein n=1 Tax=Marinobacter salexigens TaxID=1925763 RepID=A0ABS6A841_9GAMM|nr:hypothetical protein [Marinobacter salexigens]MBU2874301.1 hypothetical protein [Marinobacter salexigens]
MSVDTEGLTVPEAIRKLFGVDVAKESHLLKDKATSFVRNGLIAVRKEQKVHRPAVYLESGQGVTLHNALVLNAVFPNPKDVKRIFEDDQYRNECANVVKSLLTNRESVVGQALQSGASDQMVALLADTERNLREEPIPNPFKVLPQVALGENTTLLHVLLVQAASLEPTDSFLLAYLNGDWDAAQELSSQLSSGSAELLALKTEVDRKLTEAREFSELLSFFRKR